MSTSQKGAKVPALKLHAVGAPPAEWHIVEGLGLFHPEIPHPVGGEGDAITLARAEAFIAAHAEQAAKAREAWVAFEAAAVAAGDRQEPLTFAEPPCPVELVRITPAQADRAREQVAQARGRSARAARERASDAEGAEIEQVKDEVAALDGGAEG